VARDKGKEELDWSSGGELVSHSALALPIVALAACMVGTVEKRLI